MCSISGLVSLRSTKLSLGRTTPYQISTSYLTRSFSRCRYYSIPASKSSDTDNEQPLAGVKVIDFSGALAGPSCAMYLGDLGADVIKIERPQRGDDARGWGPPFLENKVKKPEWESLVPESAYFQSINRNKRSLTLDLKNSKAQDIVKALVKEADVVLENSITGKMGKMGIGYEQLQKIKPDLIYASVTGYGQTGPNNQTPGYDAIIGAEAGMVYSTGEPGGKPVRPGVSVTDLFAGFNAFGAILGAIIKRDRTGKGGFIDVSMFDSQAAVMSTVASNWLNAGKEARRLGTRHASVVPYQALETADGDIMVGVGNDRQFATFAKLLGREEWTRDDLYKTNSLRFEKQDQLMQEIMDIFKTKSTKQWLDLLNGSGVPHGSINGMEQVFTHPSGVARNLVSEVEHARAGNVKFVAPPVMYDGKRSAVRFAPPVLGQHTEDILSEQLGMSEKEIEALRNEKVI